MSAALVTAYMRWSRTVRKPLPDTSGHPRPEARPDTPLLRTLFALLNTVRKPSGHPLPDTYPGDCPEVPPPPRRGGGLRTVGRCDSKTGQRPPQSLLTHHRSAPASTPPLTPRPAAGILVLDPEALRDPEALQLQRKRPAPGTARTARHDAARSATALDDQAQHDQLDDLDQLLGLDMASLDQAPRPGPASRRPRRRPRPTAPALHAGRPRRPSLSAWAEGAEAPGTALGTKASAGPRWQPGHQANPALSVRSQPLRRVGST
jgi:hypothetical protein